jgi:hypothetical protein
LLIEDDVVSGMSLQLVFNEVARHTPSSVSLYLGREKASHELQIIPRQIGRVYLAEDCLDRADRARHESDFFDFFESLASSPGN